MPTAILTLIHAITRDGLQREAVRAGEAAIAASLTYARRKVESGYRAEDISTMERTGWCGIVGMHSLYADFLDWRDKVRQAKLAIRQARTVKTTDAEIRVAVSNAFAIKDALKADGYRFRQDGCWHDPFGLRVVPAWIKTVPATEEALSVLIQQLRGHGVDLRMDGDLNTLSANIRHLISHTP